MHFGIEVSFKSWRKWAVRNGINEVVTGFLSFKPDRLMVFDAGSDDTAFPTPRTWEKVSDELNGIDQPLEYLLPLVSGLIGSGTAAELLSWSRVFGELPSVESIFSGQCPPVPRRADTLYALVSSMTRYASEHRTELSRIANSIKYADRLPPDFATVLMQDYMYIEEGYRDKLMKIPEFVRWINTQGVLLNGVR